MINSFIRRAIHNKDRRAIERERLDGIKAQKQTDLARAVRLYEIEKGFHDAPIAQEYFKLKQEEADYLIAELIRVETTDPVIARLQGRIRAIHELIRRPSDPKEGLPSTPPEDEDA